MPTSSPPEQQCNSLAQSQSRTSLVESWFAQTFPGSSQLLTTIAVPAYDFLCTKKYTRVPRVYLQIRDGAQGFTGLAAAGVTEDPVVVFLLDAVGRPGLFKVSMISLVKSMFSGAYST